MTDRLEELKEFVAEHNMTSAEAWTVVEWAVEEIERLRNPSWIGEAPILEPVTFGQGSFGLRCRLCGKDDYEGVIEHWQGCPGA